MLKRSIVFLYGIVAYAAFLGTILYAIGFVANILVPRSIDGPPVGDLASSLAIDVGLLLLFAV